MLHSSLAFFVFLKFLDITSGDPRYVIEAFSFRCRYILTSMSCLTFDFFFGFKGNR